LFERLRRLRKQLADERSVPSYIIFSDVALRQMARFYPAGDREFSRISGVGEKKQREFGTVFLREITAHLQTNPRQMFADDSFSEPVVPIRSRLNDTVRETLHFFRQGKTVAEISQLRGLKDGTILSHFEEAILAGEDMDLNRLLEPKVRQEIVATLSGHRGVGLSAVFERLGGRYSYGQLRIGRALMQLGRGLEL
jgi:ATP-dependent DNA helicase RecQ